MLEPTENERMKAISQWGNLVIKHNLAIFSSTILRVNDGVEQRQDG
jgi:hypothetical protein